MNSEMTVRVNFVDGRVDPNFVVDLRAWHGVEQSQSQIVEFIQELINELESDATGMNYCLCGDTLVLVSEEDDKEFPYAVTLCKVTHRGFARKSR